jgi:hypothetical protein
MERQANSKGRGPLMAYIGRTRGKGERLLLLTRVGNLVEERKAVSGRVASQVGHHLVGPPLHSVTTITITRDLRQHQAAGLSSVKHHTLGFRVLAVFGVEDLGQGFGM